MKRLPVMLQAGLVTSRRSALARRILLAARWVLAASMFGVPAFAEDGEQPVDGPDRPEAAEVTEPKALAPLAVDYPEGARGDAVVIVELTVDVDGRVVEARSVADDGVFGRAAVDAATQWRFSPATRGGVPVNARIRVSVEFAQRSRAKRVERPTVSEGEDAHRGTLDGPAREAENAPIEVIVAGERPRPAVTTLSRAEVRQLPGAFGDPFRALEVLPGVTPIISGLPYFYLRGSPPGNVGYYVDGIRVPYLYHFALGPAAVHPGLMSRVDIHSGGYPASFGGYAGGIVAGWTSPPTPELHGEASLRLFDAGALVESGFADGRGTVLLGGRYSYTAALVSLTVPDVMVDYRDYQARVSYELGPRDRVSLFSFGSYDLVGERDSLGDVEAKFGVEFYRIDLRHEHRLSSGGELTTGVTFGFDQSHVAEAVNARDYSWAGRVALQQPLAGDALLRVGVQGSRDRYSTVESAGVDPDDPDPAPTFGELFPSRVDRVLGAYAELQFQPRDNFEVTPGLRVDYYTSGGANAAAVEPRLATRLSVSDTMRLVQAVGIASQPASFVVPVAGLSPPHDTRLQRTLQNSYGVEFDAPWDVAASAAVFHHVLLDVTDGLGTGEDLESLDTRSLGSAVGLELALRRPFSKQFGGLLTYTLSRSTRSRRAAHFPSDFDRTHVLNAVMGYDLGSNWRVGTRLVFYSGAPNPDVDEKTAVTNRTSDPKRDPVFFRVDARLEKRWDYGSQRHLSFVLEWLNASLQEETVKGEEIGPVTIPSLGLEGAF